MKAIAVLRTLASARESDVRGVLVSAFGYLVTGLVPKRTDPWLLPRLLRSSLIVRKSSIRQVKERIKSVLGNYDIHGDLDDWARQCATVGREVQWLRWRATRSENFSVTTSVDGLDRIDAALKGGRGVVLWGLDFCDPLMVKIALAQAGQRVVHLSTPEHGTLSPSTEFGRAICSPLYCLPEDRFIAQRVMIPLDGSLEYMRTLMHRLNENRCVYISGERGAKRSSTKVVVFGRKVAIPRGAPGLAHRMGSPLLPICVVRDGCLRYRAIVGDPIAPDRALPKNEFVDYAIVEFARRIENYVLAHPADWAWWGSHVASELAESGHQIATVRTPSA